MDGNQLKIGPGSSILCNFRQVSTAAGKCTVSRKLVRKIAEVQHLFASTNQKSPRFSCIIFIHHDATRKP
ncbi:hypothetical protein P3S67_022891 [Capsicum chacoense]